MDVVFLELPSTLLNRLAAHAKATGRTPEDILDAVVSDSMEPDAPSRKQVKIDCSRCGFTKHRWARTVLVRGGEFAHVFGCTKCYRLRRYGTQMIKGWEAMQEPESEPEPRIREKVKPPATRTHLWLVPEHRVMQPGVPESLQ